MRSHISCLDPWNSLTILLLLPPQFEAMSADAKEMDYSHHEGDVPKSQHNESHETLRRVYNTWTGTYRAPNFF